MSAFAGSRFQRVGEGDRRKVAFSIDGRPAVALEGDTLLVAILTNAGSLRESEFGGERRAGFCLMGACQDCWVWTASGERLRTCTMVALEGLAILTRAPEERWPSLG
ncbi:MAG TPA: (2Fe-2S)-binding protein [Geminicoccaceae bacterium]|nr:(2Fe-2S)-binding protein [Geminicoccaceae bacterium]